MLRARPLVYVRFTPERLSLWKVGTDCPVVDSPYVALDIRTNRVVAFGEAATHASNSHVHVRNGFRSERTLIGDIDVAEIAFRRLLDHVLLPEPRYFPALSPDLILHPLRVPNGGFTTFEYQGLVDIGWRAGARRVYVHIGRELSEHEILTQAYQPVRCSRNA